MQHVALVTQLTAPFELLMRVLGADVPLVWKSPAPVRADSGASA